MSWKEFPQSVTKLLRNLWKCRINLLEWLINKAFTVTNGEIAPAYVKSDSFTVMIYKPFSFLKSAFLCIYIIGTKTDAVFYYELDELNKRSESR